MKTRRTFKEKQNWVLARLEEKWQRTLRTTISGHTAPSIVASDEEDEEAWHKEFGGHRIYYTMGACTSPDFAKTLLAMYRNGILYRGTAGNQDARDGGYSQKTYYVFYRLKQHCHAARRLRGEDTDVPGESDTGSGNKPTNAGEDHAESST